jgi:hypothetical protein
LTIKANPKNIAIIMKIFPSYNFPAKVTHVLELDKTFPVVHVAQTLALEQVAHVLGQF